MRPIYTICYAITIIIFCLMSSCIASSDSDIFYSGDVIFNLDDSYDAGSEISTVIIAKNLEDFPISGAYLVIDIVRGEKDPYYPSQISDTDNIIHEEKIEDINLDSLSGKGITYTYTLPGNLQSGAYRMDVYLRTEKTPIVGIPHIFLPSRHASFTVKGTGREPSVKILRTRTHIGGYTGPVGTPLTQSSPVKGEVYVENSGNSAQPLDLVVSVCRWDDTTEDNCVTSKTFSFSLGPQKTISVPVSLTSPDKSDAYSVRLEVRDKFGNTKSLYRSRMIVEGPTAKIRKLYADSKYYEKGSEMTISALLSGSPDHYTYPEVTGATLRMTVTDNSKDTLVFERIESLPSFKNDTLFVQANHSFIVEDTLDLFEVCAEIISSDGSVYDSHCVEYDSSKFVSDTREYSVENLDFESPGTFSLDLCASDPSGMPLTASLDIDILDSSMTHAILSDQSSFTGCKSLEFIAPLGSVCTLVINDLDTRKQHTIPLDLSSFEKASESLDDDTEPENDSGSITIMAGLIILFIIVSIILFTGRRRSHAS